jgi:ribulose-phosphate 3-epimerase
VQISASILSADFAHLQDQIHRAEQAGADMIHVDVMDGHFVPNLTIGPLIVEAARRSTHLPVDVHLMVEEPDRLIHEFIEAGASILTVHQEACVHLQRTLAEIRSLGARPGVALCPSTPVSLLEHVIDDVELLLIMTVNPGFAAQELIPATIGKVRRARELLSTWQSNAMIEVDGGINPDTAPQLVEAGAEVLVAGSAIFGNGAIEANVQRLRAAASLVATR